MSTASGKYRVCRHYAKLCRCKEVRINKWLCGILKAIIQSQSKLTRLVCMKLEILNSIRTAAPKRWQLTTGWSPLVSAVHANCLWTANLLFVEVIQNQKRLMHAINDPSSVEDSCTYWVPIFYLQFLMLCFFAWYLITSVLISVPTWLKSIGSGTHTAVKWLSSLYAKVSSPHLNVSW